MASVDLVTVKDLLGHTGINMTVRYSHLAPEHKAQAVAKLDLKFQLKKPKLKARWLHLNSKKQSAPFWLRSWHKTGTFFWCEEVADWELLTKSKIIWRRRADSNRCIEVLQTSPLTTWVRRLTKIGNMNFPRVATTAEIIDNPKLNK
jgi:hypothetical protein